MSQTAEQPRTDKISDVYAVALLELSDQHQITEAMTQEVADLWDLLRAQADLRQLMESRVISRDQRTGLIERLFKGHVSDMLYHFIQVLNRKRRLDALQNICAAFGAQVAARSGKVTAEVYTASAMADDQVEHVRGVLAQAFDGREIALHHHQDASLLGGLKLRVGDQLIDASVATQLKLIKQKMIAAGREKARAAMTGDL